MTKKVAVLGTFDTKDEELSYLIETLRSYGVHPEAIDIGTRNKNNKVDVSAVEVAAAAGENLQNMLKDRDRAECLLIMAQGAAKLVRDLVDQHMIDGIICMGGGQGTFMSSIVLRNLPIGFPKMLISTHATVEGLQHNFAGINDTMILNPLVDVSGLNPILRACIRKGAAAIVGMVKENCSLENTEGVKRIGITMWGVTTPCCDQVRAILMEEGYDVYVFHATGMGGPIMDKLVEQGFLHAVADLTPTEITQPICRGTPNNVSESRMLAACHAGIPQVVSFGGMDMVSYPDNKVPKECQGRKEYWHNADLLFIRSSPEENDRCAKAIAEKLNFSKGPVTVILPLKGTSAVNYPGGPMYEPETDAVLRSSLRKYLKDEINIIEVNSNINAPLFAKKVSECIIEYLKNL